VTFLFLLFFTGLACLSPLTGEDRDPGKKTSSLFFRWFNSTTLLTHSPEPTHRPAPKRICCLSSTTCLSVWTQRSSCGPTHIFPALRSEGGMTTALGFCWDLSHSSIGCIPSLFLIYLRVRSWLTARVGRIMPFGHSLLCGTRLRGHRSVLGVPV